MLPVHGQLYAVIKWCQAENYSANLATGRSTAVQYSYSGTVVLVVPVIFYRCATPGLSLLCTGIIPVQYSTGTGSTGRILASIDNLNSM